MQVTANLSSEGIKNANLNITTTAGSKDFPITATGKATYTLSVTKSPTGTGTGTVTSSPAGINCGATCSASITSGTSVTLTANADSGSVFSGWSGACTNTTGTCTVAMDAAKSVSATFDPTPNLTNGLVAWYPFSGNANDVSVNGNNGTVNGATLTADRFGNANGAYGFNGSGDVIEVADIDLVDLVSDFSISSWINTSNSDQAMLLSKHTKGSNYDGSWWLAIGADKKIIFQGTRSTGGWGGVSSTSSISAFTWEHVVFNYQRSTQEWKIFRNGVLDNSGSFDFAIANNSRSIIIGNEGNGTQYFNGSIDDIRIYNRVISQAEVHALYTEAAPTTYTITPSTPTNGTISPATPQTVNSGATKTFTISANSGYTTDANVGGTCPAGSWSGDQYTTGAITADCTVTPTFSPILITISGNAGIAGATLSYTDGTAKTPTADGSGNYSFTVSYNWSGTVTPGSTGYIFNPTSRTYTNLIANQTTQNYTVVPKATIVSITPASPTFGEMVEFIGSYQPATSTITDYLWTIKKLNGGVPEGGAVEIGNKARFIINTLPIGNYRVYFKVRNSASDWSDEAYSDITVKDPVYSARL